MSWKGNTTLDPVSEMLALLSWGNNKSLLIPAIETEGPFDEDAGMVAVQRTAQRFPHMGLPLKEIRRNGLFQLEANISEAPVIPVTADEMSADYENPRGPDHFLAHLAQRLDRQWDIFHEPPVEVHFLRLSRGRQLIVPVIHHVSGDAVTAAEFVREWLLNYHEVVKGKGLLEHPADRSISRPNKRTVFTGNRRLKEFLLRVRDALLQSRERPVGIAGSGEAGDSRQFHVKRLFSREETSALARRSREIRASLSALMIGATNIAVDRWNESWAIPPGLISTALSVDLRRRWRGQPGPNTSSLLFFRSFPEKRADFDQFVQMVAAETYYQLRNRKDVQYIEDVARLCKTLRALPFKLRRRIVSLINKNQRCPLFIIPLKALWPTLETSDRSAESGFPLIGDLRIKEVHAVGYKLCSDGTPTFITYKFEGRLNVMFSVPASIMTRAESERFMDLTMAQLLS